MLRCLEFFCSIFLLISISSCQQELKNKLYFVGDISGLKSKFDLEVDNNKLAGVFYYLKNPAEIIEVKGEINANRVVINEYNSSDKSLTGVFKGIIINNRFEGYWSDPSNKKSIKFSYSIEHDKSDYLASLSTSNPKNILPIVNYNITKELVKNELKKINFCKYFQGVGLCNPVHSIVEYQSFSLTQGYRLYVLSTTIPYEDYTCNICSPVISLFVFRPFNDSWILESLEEKTILEGFRGEYQYGFTGNFQKVGKNIVGINENMGIWSRGLLSSSPKLQPF